MRLPDRASVGQSLIDILENVSVPVNLRMQNHRIRDAGSMDSILSPFPVRSAGAGLLCPGVGCTRCRIRITSREKDRSSRFVSKLGPGRKIYDAAIPRGSTPSPRHLLGSLGASRSQSVVAIAGHAQHGNSANHAVELPHPYPCAPSTAQPGLVKSEPLPRPRI